MLCYQESMTFHLIRQLGICHFSMQCFSNAQKTLVNFGHNSSQHIQLLQKGYSRLYQNFISKWYEPFLTMFLFLLLQRKERSEVPRSEINSSNAKIQHWLRMEKVLHSAAHAYTFQGQLYQRCTLSKCGKIAVKIFLHGCPRHQRVSRQGGMNESADRDTLLNVTPERITWTNAANSRQTILAGTGNVTQYNREEKSTSLDSYQQRIVAYVAKSLPEE